MKIDSTLYKKFLKEYDNGELEFTNLKYRQGATITCPFGLTEGYRKENGEFIWDSVRIHTGVDRAGTDVVYSPFHFQRSTFYDFGEDHVYGSMVRLYQDEYQFEMRILHMDPEKDINPEILKALKAHEPIRRNAYLGKDGSYGAADGDHTHTEIVSYEETNPMLNFILYEKYGEQFVKPYSEDYIKAFYKSREYFKNKTESKIFNHFNKMLDSRRIPSKNFFNEHFFQFLDWFSPDHATKKTKYSSEHLFNGL
jgi:hypothetical protein